MKGNGQGGLLRVSTIVVMHNRRPLNEWILKSYLETTRGAEGIELVCVDNGSTDGTAELLDEAHERGLLKLLRTKKNVYLGPAWNRALSLVDPAADLVGKVDNDSYFKPGWLPELRRVALQSDAEVIIASDARADWCAIYHLRGEELAQAIERADHGQGWLVRTKDYGGNLYFRRSLIERGLRYPPLRRMTVDSNVQVLTAARKKKARVVRLRPGYFTWEKVRWTDPACRDYYNRTFRERRLTKNLKARRLKERDKIARGKLALDYAEDPLCLESC